MLLPLVIKSIKQAFKEKRVSVLRNGKVIIE